MKNLLEAEYKQEFNSLLGCLELLDKADEASGYLLFVEYKLLLELRDIKDSQLIGEENLEH